MIKTRTFKRLFAAAEASTPARQFTAAASAWMFLTTVAQCDRPELPVSRGTVRRRVAELRRAGVAPIASSSQLVHLARDLGVSDRDSLTRLVWVLNAQRHSTRAGIDRAAGPMVGDAMAAIEAEAHLDQHPMRYLTGAELDARAS